MLSPAIKWNAVMSTGLVERLLDLMMRQSNSQDEDFACPTVDRTLPSPEAIDTLEESTATRRAY